MGKITYRIDRLISTNNVFELGLKTGASLSVIANTNTNNRDLERAFLQSATLLRYASAPSVSFATSGNNKFKINEDSPFNTGANENDEAAIRLIPNVDFVQKYAKNQTNIILNHLYNNYLKLGTPTDLEGTTNSHLAITPSGSESNPSIYIRVTPLYTASETIQTALVDGQSATVVGSDANAHLTVGSMDASAHNFITGFTTDEFGKITGVQTKAVSTSDMNFDGATLDNYRSWAFDIVGGNSPSYVLSAYANHDDTNPTGVPNIVFGGNHGLVPSISTQVVGNNITVPKIVYDINFDNTSFEYDSSAGGLNQFALKTIEGVEQTTAALLNVAIDTKGRITSKSAVDSTQITNLVAEFSASQKGIVKPQGNDNTTTATADSTYFLTSTGAWATLPIAKVQVADLSSNNNQYPLLASADQVSAFNGTAANRTAVAATAVYLTGAGKIHATAFEGDGSNLTNIDVDNLYGGSGGTHKIDASLINISGTLSGKTNLVTELGLTGIRANTSGHYAANKVIITNSSGELTTTNATISGITEAGTAILAAEYDANGAIRSDIAIQWKSLKQLVTTVVAGEGGMRFMGVLGDGTSGTVAWSSAESSFKKGDFYKVGSVENGISYGPFTGHLETGDTIFAVADKPNGYDAMTDANKQQYWTVIQSNLENALTLDSTAISTGTTYNVPILDNSNHSVHAGFNVTVNAAGDEYTLGNTVANKAKTLETARSIWGVNFDGSAAINGAMTGVGTITPLATDTHTLGTSEVVWNAAWINTVHGKADTAGVADSVAHSLNVYFGSKPATDPVPNVVFNGSADTDLILNWDQMDVFDAVSNAVDNTVNSGNGNVITAVNLSRSSDDHSTLVCTVQKGITALTDVTSTIFAISGTGAERAISFFNGTPASSQLAFYTSGEAPSLVEGGAGVGQLKLYGGFQAAFFKAYKQADGTMVDVALKTKEKPGTAIYDATTPLLVADANVNGSTYYSFKSSGISVSRDTLTDVSNSEVTIPTTKAVVDYVKKTKTAISAGTKVEVMKVPFNADTNGSTASFTVSAANAIPSGSVVDHIDVYIASAFAAGVTFKLVPNSHLNDTTTYLVISDSEIDLTDSGTCFSYKFSRPITTVANDHFQPVVVLGGITAGDSGTGTCYIYYTKEQLQNQNLS